MAITATLTEPTLEIDWFAEQLTAVATFFAARPPADDHDTEHGSEISGRTDPPGEPVDTSHHEEPQSPIASTGDSGGSSPRRGGRSRRSGE
ncbi:hypothetical protein EIL87_22300 [Saccharopolyspora rhizosphaerae]|uniref:Uncharacterized protein n=1 Tax=Saccharopolyspora rhizosphaerae TaxID=2492662 RepID=A0A426JKV5_9PSEU|nr:hypothetical protein [Saccharopolyspora rhizosphaerae]RRO13720.1 hypothetical protein EIL87_22300 [Saccharopolyspora rhizosphaerae]